MNDELNLDDVTMNLKGMDWGSGSGGANTIGSLADSMGMKFDMEDETYNTQMTIPIVNHPGAGNQKNDPWDRVANTKMEPTLRGSEAKLGMMNQDWFTHPDVKNMLGDERYNTLMEEIGGIDEDFGVRRVGNSNKTRRFESNEIEFAFPTQTLNIERNESK